MKGKPRLGRKDIFAESRITRKPERKIPGKPGKKKAKRPENQETRKTKSQEKIKVTFQIPEDLFIQIKIKAAQERKKISDLVRNIFSEYLGRK